eukprot:3199782-Alexandrium_andersonii.AAC.1
MHTEDVLPEVVLSAVPAKGVPHLKDHPLIIRPLLSAGSAARRDAHQLMPCGRHTLRADRGYLRARRNRRRRHCPPGNRQRRRRIDHRGRRGTLRARRSH